MDAKQKLLSEFDESDRRMRDLVGSLDESHLDVPYEIGINPPIWEMGHAAFFYEYFLLRELYGGESRMPGFDEVWDSFEIPHRERWRPGVVTGKTRRRMAGSAVRPVGAVVTRGSMHACEFSGGRSLLQLGDHKTTRGGSCATSSSLIRSTYRQAYFPTRRDIFTGFRTCVI